ncbi:tripartite tricarboxylate transporter substrate binding protein [Desulfovibrio sp. OttesenSCG-928-O18]|nr:tripartite tricarboxylate transporter substrate binding protein [Desulfovibrio sp. OttesenSCG-928-O18]
MKLKRFSAVVAVVCAFVIAGAVPAFAKYPERPITMIVPWGAGGGSDILARALVKPLEKELGQTVIVVNKAGGSGTVGTSFVAHARPDGYTIGLINSTGVIHQIHYGGVDYKKEDLDPLCLLLQSSVMLSVHADSEVKTLADYIKYTKDHPNTTLGVAAVGGATHLAVEDFFMKAGVKVQPMPFKDGGRGAATALVGKHIFSASNDPSELYGQIKAGTVRPLAVSNGTRLPNYPDVPTFKELGYDSVNHVWRCFFAPKGISAEVRDTLVKAIEKAAQDPGYLETVAKLGDTPVFMGPVEFKKYLDEDDAKMLNLIKALNLYQKNVK